MSCKIKQALDDVLELRRSGVHRKCLNRETYDVALLLACTQACADILPHSGDLPACAKTAGFMVTLFRMTDGPVAMMSLFQTAKTWTIPLDLGMHSHAAVVRCLHSLRLSIKAAKFQSKPFGDQAKFLVQGIRLNGQHTGLDVVDEILKVDWRHLKLFAECAGALLVCDILEFIVHYDAFCEARTKVFFSPFRPLQST